MRRKCSKCKEHKPLKGGYNAPNKFICNDCKDKEVEAPSRRRGELR